MARPTSGQLRTLATFYEQSSGDSYEPVEEPTVVVTQAWAQVYGASTKDRTILSDNDRKSGITIKIRDSRGEFVPDPSKHTVVLDDYRYQNVEWNILDVRPDFDNDSFIVLVLTNAQEPGNNMESGDVDGR
ncbi:phage head-tail adapter protein [Lacticaseibacillus pabuli]|uniref:Phage head-tail adapter protein n=1 Tax=Lacticaseibacillus pabuli TaxID=3025672 RepID=A0ABY7WRR4_9LACO|nr:phage head-tail adapter protein [Lacticaseibacillus sp. KACC 23028]WDF81815.1 phage head-tail adapter protein [Lacticaseibacillus sp. KACC 23028]